MSVFKVRQDEKSTYFIDIYNMGQMKQRLEKYLHVGYLIFFILFTLFIILLPHLDPRKITQRL